MKPTRSPESGWNRKTIGFYVFGDGRDDEAVRLGSRWEARIRGMFEAAGFVAEPRGKSVEAFRYVNGVRHKKPSLPDFLIRTRGKRAIAWVEITGSRKKREKFLIQVSKIKNAEKLFLPKYLVYYIDETGEIFWIDFKTIEKCERRILKTRWLGEAVSQRAFIVPRGLWNPGLEGLLRELSGQNLAVPSP